ncbi:hypothetical protein [Reyranella sp.]|uniref:hypothetical protein n=1 Tax=Reyranella sp. TaxID=1929291 RepID=UPI004036CF5B
MNSSVQAVIHDPRTRDDFIRLNSIERPAAITRWASEGDHNDDEFGCMFWRVLSEEWSGFDKIDRRVFEEMFNRFQPSWRPPETGFYQALPARFVAYRGADAREHSQGLGFSWTLSRQVARSFARGHRGMPNDQPTLFAAILNSRDVALALNDRKEMEVVLFQAPLQFRTISW